MANLVRGGSYGGNTGKRSVARCPRELGKLAFTTFSSPYHFRTWHMCFLLDRRNHIKVESVYRQLFGYYQRNRNDVLTRLPTGDGATTVHEQEKAVRDPRCPRRDWLIGEVIVRVRASQVYTL